MRFLLAIGLTLLGLQSSAFAADYEVITTNYVCGAETATVDLHVVDDYIVRCQVGLNDTVWVSADSCQQLADDEVFAQYGLSFSPDSDLLTAFGEACELAE